jgi:hypothetical protein
VSETCERVFIPPRVVALTAVASPRAKRRDGRQVWHKPKPLEIVEDAALELGA